MVDVVVVALVMVVIPVVMVVMINDIKVATAYLTVHNLHVLINASKRNEI